jgi:hypothetical protein
MDREEVAAALGLTVPTVKRDLPARGGDGMTPQDDTAIDKPMSEAARLSGVYFSPAVLPNSAWCRGG